VRLSKFAQKQFLKLPKHIQTSFRVWVDLIEKKGISEMRRVPGYMNTNSGASEFFESHLGPMTFGQFLTAARTSVDMSQIELARKLKVSRSMICDIEKGRVLVSPALAVKIAKLGHFPSDMAVKYCLQDQLRRAKIKFNIHVLAA
jgi:DNA-binding XRE family transcriptional regulator